ncbi:glycosyltransferase [Mycobacterium sp. NPDC051804]|uniref:glycosyltransferase n=1 Tax=Mycobacterium sp. NPDC051804 TaxID=3364295 RepID=UPI0037B1C225
MRILQVVTLLSPDASYGGPVRVAVNQSKELRDRGHEVVIAAAARGYDQLPTGIDGIPVQAFPAKTALPGIGFAGTRGAGMSRWIADNAKHFDVAHIHLARDFVTLPAARTCLKRSVPIVAQPHGMIDHSSRLLAKPLDLFWTAPVLRSASTVLFLTSRERDDLRGVAQPLPNLRELSNGVPQAVPRDTTNMQEPHEVLFLARLHPRKRPAIFVEMARRLVERGVAADFAIVGPDEGTLSEVNALITRYGLQSRMRYEGALAPDLAADRMRRAAIYVLPSIDEPFPMSVLEAMSVGVPVVVTDTCGLASLIEETGSGSVVGSDLDSLTDAVHRLLEYPHLLATAGRNAYDTATDRLGMSLVVDALEDIYKRAVE